jgi:hypothetical protein
MLTRPLFICPACGSQDVIAIATPASAPVHLWFDARCRACGLCEIELVRDTEADAPIVTRWLAPQLTAVSTSAVELACPQCQSRQLVLTDRIDELPACAFCGHASEPLATDRVWN